MEVKYISVDRAVALEESINFLSNYKGPDKGETHQIGISANVKDRNDKYTELLERLGKINNERDDR